VLEVFEVAALLRVTSWWTDTPLSQSRHTFHNLWLLELLLLLPLPLPLPGSLTGSSSWALSPSCQVQTDPSSFKITNFNSTSCLQSKVKDMSQPPPPSTWQQQQQFQQQLLSQRTSSSRQHW
jgi:hypothetical protein